jgi:hypothetical protein
MFGKRAQHKGELIIPPIAAGDPSGKEVLRGWVANDGFHVSLHLVWVDPATWGVAFADIARHLADAYHASKGLDKDETIESILALLHAELESPTDKPTGQLID